MLSKFKITLFNVNINILYYIKSKLLYNNINFILKIQQSVVIFVICLICLIIFLNLFIKKKLFLLNNLFYLLISILYSLKFLINVYIVQHFPNYLIAVSILNNNYKLKFYENFALTTGIFGDSIVFLCIVTGFICLKLLGNKNLFKSLSNFFLFFLFFLFVNIMVHTNNLLIIFLSFEFIFLPTIYFVYNLGYTKKLDKSCEYLFYWTLFGSFLVLSSISYIYAYYKTLNYNLLVNTNFTKKEIILLYLSIFIGFGIKIPVFPFQYWLIKVHVEAPTGFSIFLSGFLVKSALYCFYIFNLLFENFYIKLFILFWCILGLIFATIGLYKQEDIKKLIAWTTIQEMTLMLLFIIFKQSLLNISVIIFILLHGLISSYMFYLVDVLQRKFNSRHISDISGVTHSLPKLAKYIWILILIFNGFPLTVKFFIEWSLVLVAYETPFFMFIIICILINYLAVISFTRFFLIVLYSGSVKNKKFIELSKTEYSIFNYLLGLIILLSLIFYVI